MRIRLARDERYEDGFSDTAEVDVNADESVDARRTESGKVNALAEFSIPLKDGRRITVCDYSSAGKCGIRKRIYAFPYGFKKDKK